MSLAYWISSCVFFAERASDRSSVSISIISMNSSAQAMSWLVYSLCSKKRKQTNKNSKKHMCRKKSWENRIKYKIHADHPSKSTVTFSFAVSCGVWQGLILMCPWLSWEQWSSSDGECLAVVHRAMELVEQLTVGNVELLPLRRHRHPFDGI